jgi:hypothetical protein
MGYIEAEEFTIPFKDGTCANCTALIPPESIDYKLGDYNRMPYDLPIGLISAPFGQIPMLTYHQAPEIFVSQGSPGSIVDKWVQERGGFGGLHHIAYEVDDVAEAMRTWKVGGYAEFTKDEPIQNAEGLTQCFTKPIELLGGMVFEFIKRGRDNKGFNVDSVRELMESTDD